MFSSHLWLMATCLNNQVRILWWLSLVDSMGKSDMYCSLTNQHLSFIILDCCFEMWNNPVITTGLLLHKLLAPKLVSHVEMLHKIWFVGFSESYLSVNCHLWFELLLLRLQTPLSVVTFNQIVSKVRYMSTFKLSVE